MSVVCVVHGGLLVQSISSTMDGGCKYPLVVARVLSSRVSYFGLQWLVWYQVVNFLFVGSSRSLSSVLGKVFGHRGRRGCVSGIDRRRIV